MNCKMRIVAVERAKFTLYDLNKGWNGERNTCDLPFLDMKCDMGGAAAVVGTFYNLVSSGFTQNLHCILCIAENNISPAAKFNMLS